MNSSSVQLFPSRVQLFGLPPTADLLPPPPVRPPIARKQCISRNLFGAPNPGEITHLLNEETQRQCAYMLQRYSFDIKAAAAAAKDIEESTAVKESPQQPLASLGLIAQELRDNERRFEQQQQQQEKCNLRRDQATAEITPPHDANNAAKRAQLSQIRRIVAVAAAVHQCNNNNNSNNNAAFSDDDAAATESSIPMGNASDRLKPYARQTLLPDFYSLRKTKQFNGRTALTVNRSQHRLLEVEVLQLPKPMRLDSAAITSSSTTTAAAEITTAAPPENKSTNEDDNETLSLQVSTESAPLVSSAACIHPKESSSSLSLSLSFSSTSS